MQTNEDLLLRAIDTANIFDTATATTHINPQLWSKKIEDYARANLVIAPLGVTYNDLMNKPGESMVIPKDAAITAGALTETTSISNQSLTYTSLQVTPTEYGGAFQISRKEIDRALANVIDEKARGAGYALAKVKDDTLFEALVTGATSTVYPASKTAASDVATSDVFSTDLIAEGITTMRILNRNPTYLVVHPYQEGRLLKASDFIDASKYGSREVIMNGEIGKYLGLKVFSTTVATTVGIGASTASTGYNALLLGPRAFAYVPKRTPTIDSKYEPLDRAFTVAYVEDWGYGVLNADEIAVLVTDN